MRNVEMVSNVQMKTDCCEGVGFSKSVSPAGADEFEFESCDDVQSMRGAGSGSGE